MFEAGMFTVFAAAIAVRSRGFASASPPPWRAAIVISLMYFENILPRAWSVAAFLRLIVAHLEWPDIVMPGALRRFTRRARPPPSPHAPPRSRDPRARAARPRSAR